MTSTAPFPCIFHHGKGAIAKRKDMQETTYSVSYYDVLQLPVSSSDEDVKKAYRRLAMRFHPDRNPSDKRMAELRLRLINEAYTHLKTKKDRTRYNRILKKQMTVPKAQNDNKKGEKHVKTLFMSGLDTLVEILWPIANKNNKGHM